MLTLQLTIINHYNYDNPMKKICIIAAVLLFFCFSCTKYEEVSLEEFNAMSLEGLSEILAETVSKPWRGEDFINGRVGGTWYSVMNEDPKSFNQLIAEQDSATAAVVKSMTDYLLDYDFLAREWKPRSASARIVVDEKNNTMQVVYTLRNDLYWSYYNSNRKEKVTSDDVIFWYNEIEGDPDFQSSGYYGQFLTMPDGSDARVTIQKIDDLSFAFNFPRIIAEPFLMTNMDFGPRHIYEPAKRQGGVEGVKNLFNVSVDPKTIPSMGEWFLVEYTVGQRLVYRRNPDFWMKDTNGVSLPYVEENIVRIIPDENTQMLMFQRGDIDSYSLRPEDIDGIILNRRSTDYTVFNREGSLSASIW